jgi:NRPS condensation-like uncharacterized protein
VSDGARLTEEDELFLRLDRPGEPWSVHAELWLSGQLDLKRLRSSTVRAMELHPMARASLGQEAGAWRISAEVEPSIREEQVEGGDRGLNGLREDFLSRTPSLDAPPPFDLLVARRRGGDALLLNLNHVAGDGIGAFRLLSSILRAYAGKPDAPASVDPLRMRDLREFADRRTLRDRLRRLRERSEHRDPPGPAADVAAAGRREGDIAGLRVGRLEPGLLERARSRRRSPATFNDLLLASFVVALRAWNDERGVEPHRVVLRVPVNIRPPAWSDELIANLAATLEVAIPPDAQCDLDLAQAAVAERTQALKGQEFASIQAAGGVIPVWVRRLLGPLIPAPSESPDDTAVLSNVGQARPPTALGPDLRVEALYFSPPVRMPSGLSLGVASYGEGLFIVLRYGPELFGDDAAAEFADRFLRVLVGG